MFLPVEQWEIGIDGKRDNETGVVTLGVNYPYKDEATGRKLMDLLAVALRREGGKWLVVQVTG